MNANTVASSKRAFISSGERPRIDHDHYGRVGGVFGSLPRTLKLMFQALFEQQLPKPNFLLPLALDRYFRANGAREATQPGRRVWHRCATAHPR